MPAKVKGMTSIEVAVLVAIVLAIAIAVGWYLYTTFAASVGAQAKVKVVSAIGFTNGTIKIEVVNTGATHVTFTHAEVFERVYPVRGGFAYFGPGMQGVVYIDTGRWVRQGSIIEGTLISEGGIVVAFTARVR